MEKGDKGKEIKLIQIALEKDGVFQGDEITTYFGNITLKSAKEFQKKYGLTRDGVIGKNTLKKMEELNLFPKLSETLYKKGNQGEDIILIQQALKLEGYFEGEYSVVFGPKTEAAVKAFQKAHGLIEDGVESPDYLNSKQKQILKRVISRTKRKIDLAREQFNLDPDTTKIKDYLISRR